MRAGFVASLVLVIGAMIVANAAAQEKINPQHYQCYGVVDPKPFKSQQVQLQDQFGASRLVAVKPLFLCNPVSKNKEPIADKLTHLVCYQIVKGQPARKRVEVSNQFGPESLSVNTPQLLCVPSVKKVLG
jgi:hypothetical protein